MTFLREIVRCLYHYDPLDRLTSCALPDFPVRKRFYCESRMSTEIYGTMHYSIVQNADQLLAQQQGEGESIGITLLTTDHQRSVLQAINVSHPPQPISYTPYGHRSVESGLFSLLGFNGEPPDPVTGCYLLGNGYRAFNPVLMRFNGPDSWSPFGKGGLNPYAYCLNDPMNMVDLDGRHPLKFLTRPLSKKFRSLKNRFTSKPALTLDVSGPEPSAVNMGPFFKLEGTPHIQDMIMRSLPGKDLVSFSLVSKNTNRMVQNAKIAPKTVLGSAVDLKEVSENLHSTLIGPVNRIISGKVNGVLPGDFQKTNLGQSTRSHKISILGGRFRSTSFKRGQMYFATVIRQT